MRLSPKTCGSARDQLVSQAADHLANVEGALLSRELRVKEDLQEQVAQLSPQGRQVARVDRLQHFVGFFEQVLA